MNIVLAVLILGGIILFHELGHFIFAKLSGIEVTEFSLGMGPRLLSFVKGETRYSLKLLPFGGSCAMLGEDEDAEGDRAFNNKPVFNRIAVVVGGPLFNFILAFLLSLVIVGCAGGFYEPVVMGVEEGYPAEQAGILTGDVIIKVDHRAVHSYRDLSPYLTAHPHQDVTITWKHTDENGNYQELSYLISCGGKRIFFGGDLSLYDGLTERLAELHPDIMLLPVNGRDYYLTAANIIGNTNCREAAELAKRCKAACLIPMHHDLYAINGCRENWVREAAADAGVPVRILRCGEHIAFF